MGLVIPLSSTSLLTLFVLATLISFILFLIWILLNGNICIFSHRVRLYIRLDTISFSSLALHSTSCFSKHLILASWEASWFLNTSLMYRLIQSHNQFLFFKFEPFSNFLIFKTIWKKCMIFHEKVRVITRAFSHWKCHSQVYKTSTMHRWHQGSRITLMK